MLLKSSNSNNKILEKPFVNSQKYMINYAEKFNLAIPVHHKFKFAEYSKTNLEKIDAILT